VNTRRPFGSLAGTILWICLAGSAQVSSAQSDLPIAGIESHLQRWHEVDRFHGVALVAIDDTVVSAAGHGLADRESGISHRPDTQFDIRSIGKQFTCVLILQLASEGRLNLEDPLIQHLPEYRTDTGQQVSIGHLLRHDSGIPCFLNDSHRRASDRPKFDPTGDIAIAEFMEEFLSEDLLFEPGETYSYSNSGYYLLALVAERITGKKFESLLSERLFKPIGMTRSGAMFGSERFDDLANGYVVSFQGYRRSDPWRPKYFKGSGGVFSTAEDLLRWSVALHSGSLLSAEWMALMREPYTQGPPPRHAYAMDHFSLRRPDVESVAYTGFSGGGQGYASDVLRFDDGRVTVILLENTSQYNHWRIGPELYDLVVGRIPPEPLPLLSSRLVARLREEGWRAALDWHDGPAAKVGRFQRDGLERSLNTMGYSVLVSDCSLAVEIFRLNAAIHIDSSNAFDSLGEGLAMNGLSEESQVNFAMAKNLQDRSRRLRAALQDQLWNEAREIVRVAKTNHPASRPLPDRMAGPMVEQALAAGDGERAEMICSIWRASDPQALGPLFSLCRVYRIQNDTDRLGACYRSILELDPENKYARAALDEFE
jgi:CubicO group peptidase (beta-lactamase class C family)